ncbi:MAG: hypothetical protein ABIU77_09780 [Ferruginibacter sp.]
MKNTFIVATAAALAGTAVALYFFRRRNRNINLPVLAENPRPHHITSVFADAKKQMSHIKPEEV